MKGRVRRERPGSPQPCRNRRRRDAGRSARRNRSDRRGDARTADGARPDHRSADRDQGAPGRRLGVPAGARSGDDARDRRAPPRHVCRSTPSRASGASSSRPSPMCRPPIRVHVDVSRGDAADARFRALPFRLHRALRRRIMSAAAVIDAVARGVGRSRHVRARRRRRRPARGGRGFAPPTRRRSSRACRSSSGRIIPPACRSSSSPSRSPTAAARDVVLEAVVARPLARRLSRRRSRALGGEIIGNAADGMGLSLLIARPGALARARSVDARLREAGARRRSERRRSARTPRASTRRRCA